MREKDKKLNEFTQKITVQVTELFNEDCENHISNEDIEKYATEFIYALGGLMPSIIYQKLSGEQTNVLSTNHMINQLCFQFTDK